MNEQRPSTSAETEKTSVEPITNDEQLIDPFIDFECHVCRMKERTLFGELNVVDGSFDSPVYFMRDPFKPPSRDKAKKPCIDDFLVLGAPCSACNQPVCMSDTCSLFFGTNFCAPCVSRERRRFPPQLTRGILTKNDAKQESK